MKACDFERLRRSLESGYDARRYMVEQTVYYDWLDGCAGCIAKAPARTRWWSCLARVTG